MPDLRVDALYDIWSFCDLIDFKGGRNSFYDLHYEMAEFNCRQQTHSDNKREYRRRITLVPREHFKSTINTVLYTLWRVYRNPNIRIFVACCAKDLAQAFIREIRAYFENPNLIEEVWNNRPHIEGPLIPPLKSQSSGYKRTRADDTEAKDSKVVWSNWALQVNRDLIDKQPTIEAVSVNMSLTGKHADLCILDDIVDLTNSDSEIKARKVKKWADDLEFVVTKKAVRTEVSPGFHEYVGGEILINGTRYHPWDYYSNFVGNDPKTQEERIAKTKYSLFIRDIYKNGRDNSDGYICPELFDEEAEHDMLATDSMDPYTFYCQFRNKIMVLENQDLSYNNIRIARADSYKRTQFPGLINFIDHGDQTELGPKVYPVPVKMYLDLATVSVRSRTDSCTYLIGGWDTNRRFHIVAAKKGRWTQTEHFENVYNACMHWNLPGFYFESGVGYQSTFRSSFYTWCEAVNKKTKLICTPSQAVRSIKKTDRIKATLQPIMESGSMVMHLHVSNSGQLVTEMQFFDPDRDDNADDLLDTLEMTARNTKPREMMSEERKRRGYDRRINTYTGGTRY